MAWKRRTGPTVLTSRWDLICARSVSATVVKAAMSKIPALAITMSRADIPWLDKDATADLASVSEVASILTMINRLFFPVGRSERDVASDELGLRTAAITVTLSRVKYLVTNPRPIPEGGLVEVERESGDATCLCWRRKSRW